MKVAVDNIEDLELARSHWNQKAYKIKINSCTISWEWAMRLLTSDHRDRLPNLKLTYPCLCRDHDIIVVRITLFYHALY